MQAIKNKLQGKSKRQSREQRERSGSLPATYSRDISSTGGIVTSYKETHQDLPGTHVDRIEKTEVFPSSSTSSLESSIPIPPPAPPVDFWKDGDVEYYSKFWIEAPIESQLTSTRTVEIMPTEIIEKPMVVHEDIRYEQVEEIQPIIQVEREKTEVRQITMPLLDKEIKPVLIEERTLPVEILPTIMHESTTVPDQLETSSRSYETTKRQILEKNPIIQESEKWRIIEEVQPIIYRETVIPHIIRTSRPMREVIVEAPVVVERSFQYRELTIEERARYSKFFAQETVVREVIPESLIPIIPSLESSAIRIVPAASDAVVHKKEIIEETTTVTTTTSAVPTVASAIRSSRDVTDSSRIGAASFVQEPAVRESHSVKTGPMGEKIVTDSITTTSHSQMLMPTRAI